MVLWNYLHKEFKSWSFHLISGGLRKLGHIITQKDGLLADSDQGDATHQSPKIPGVSAGIDEIRYLKNWVEARYRSYNEV